MAPSLNTLSYRILCWLSQTLTLTLTLTLSLTLIATLVLAHIYIVIRRATGGSEPKLDLDLVLTAGRSSGVC